MHILHKQFKSIKTVSDMCSSSEKFVQLIEQGQVVIPTGSMIKGSRHFYWILLKEANLLPVVSIT